MSDLLNQASLVMVPSGYKEDTVYSVVPSDGSGDLSFTRASNGTRINSAGLVEVAPWNLLQQSEALNTTWSDFGTGITVTANATTAPNGTNTADLLEFPASVGSAQYVLGQIVNLTAGVPYTFSFWAKAVSGTITNLVVRINGTEVALGETITTEWQRFTKTLTPTTASDDTGFKNRSSVSGSGTAINVYIWGAQLNIGSTAKPYFPTTDRLNVPRLTYQNGGGGCPSLLLEKQSTNLFTYSEQLNNADWFTTGLTVTANQAISPDGTQNADLLDDGTASSTQHWIYQGTSFANSTTYTISFYAKYVSRKYMSVNIYNGSTSQYVDYDIENGLVYGSTGDVTASITSVGNGWYRVVYTRTMASSGSPNFRIAMADDTGSETYTGSNKQLYLWGMQCEASSYPTSYIPTTSSSATRVADACYKTGISSLIGQTEGTMFVDWNFENKPDSNGSIPMVLSGVLGEAYIFVTAGGTLLGEVYNLGLQASISGGIGGIGRKKIALAYKQNDFALYMNGTQIGTDTSGTVSAMSTLYVGSYYVSSYAANSGINEAILFPTRLTNAELASLTTI